MKSLWTITLPRFRCPHCGKMVNNLKFKGRLVPLRKKKGEDIDRGSSISDVNEDEK